MPHKRSNSSITALPSVGTLLWSVTVLTMEATHLQRTYLSLQRLHCAVLRASLACHSMHSVIQVCLHACICCLRSLLCRSQLLHTHIHIHIAGV